MSDDLKTNDLADPVIRHRTITLADGRYMVFYTFGDEPAPGDNEVDDQGEDV